MLITILIAICLGYVTGHIAEAKGHSFWKWWLYGALLFAVAILHVQMIEDLNNPDHKTDESIIMDELRRYRDLFDAGSISKEEYEKKKRELLGI